MAWLFDEANDYVTLAANSALNLPDGDWTIAGWVNLTDNTGSAFQYLLSWGSFGAVNTFQLYVTESSVPSPNENQRDDLSWNVIDTDGDSVSSQGASNPPVFNAPSGWYHIVFERNGSIVSTYVDNSFIHSQIGSGLNGVSRGDALYFGTRSDLNADRFFGGAMAEFGKWNRSLLDSERAALAKGFAPSFFRRSLQWYLPMIRDYREMQQGIAVTNNGSTITAHPNIIYPAGPYIIRAGTAPGDTHSFIGSAGVTFDGSAALEGSTIASFTGAGTVSMDGDIALTMRTPFAGSAGLSMDGTAGFSGQVVFPGTTGALSFDGDVTLNAGHVFGAEGAVNMNGVVSLNLKHRFAGSGTMSFDGNIDLTTSGWTDVDEPFGPTWSNAT